MYNCSKNLSPTAWAWRSNSKSSSFGRLGKEMFASDVIVSGVATSSHSSTLERLYAWEKKLFEEVKVILLLKLLRIRMNSS